MFVFLLHLYNLRKCYSSTRTVEHDRSDFTGIGRLDVTPVSGFPVQKVLMGAMIIKAWTEFKGEWVNLIFVIFCNSFSRGMPNLINPTNDIYAET